MERDIDILKISDGKKYSSNDLVKIACNDCEGCHKCCQNMDELITLDPYDIHIMLSGLLDITFDKLIDDKITFMVDKGVLIPSLKMDENTGNCKFLNSEGRCSIHSFRPGICRLFPMGRLYEDGGFTYFLQKDECDYKTKSKVKIKNWIGFDEIGKYEKFVSDWHYFIKDIQGYIQNVQNNQENSGADETSQINSMIIKIFYLTPYSESFYEDFYLRLNKVKELM